LLVGEIHGFYIPSFVGPGAAYCLFMRRALASVSELAEIAAESFEKRISQPSAPIGGVPSKPHKAPSGGNAYGDTLLFSLETRA